MCCGVWGYWYLKELKRPKTNPLSIMPDTCFALIETEDIQDLIKKINQGNLMWEEGLKTEEVHAFNQLLLYVDSVYTQSHQTAYFATQNTYIALYKQKKTIPLVAFNLLDINTSDFFLSFLKQHFSAKKNQEQIYNCLYKERVFYAYVRDGLVALCSDLTFLQEALKNTNTALSKNTLFMQEYNNEGKENDFSVFLHFPYFYKQAWDSFFVSDLKKHFSYGSQKESWILADLDIQPTEIQAQGFFSNDSSTFYNTLKKQENIYFKDVTENLPYNTSLFQAISIKNYATFSLLSKNEKNTEALKQYTEKLSANINTELEKIAGDYISEFIVHGNEGATTLGVAQLSDEPLAYSFLKTISDSSFQTQDSVTVFFDKQKALFSVLSGGFFQGEFSYITYVNRTFLFGNSIQALSDCKKNILKNNTLQSNEQVMDFITKNSSEKGSFLFFSEVAKQKNNIENKLSQTLNKWQQQNPDIIGKYEYAAATLEGMKNLLYFKASTRFGAENKWYQNTLWETAVDTDLYLAPIPVKNHITNETELVCADKKHNLYLLTNTGKILWKKNIGEAILGSVYQVDYFGNNKLQLLFNTASALFLIDRNGKEVADFPVKIKQGAVDGLTLFDYDKNKKYRLWVPQKNGSTACLAINGKPLMDFTPVKNTGKPIRLTLQQKDYFVLIDSSGAINVCNRKGEKRISITHTIPDNSSNAMIIEGKTPNNTYIAYFYKQEKKRGKIFLNDKTEEILIPIENTIEYAFSDTTQRPFSQIYLSKGTLSVFDFFEKKQQEIKIPFEIKNSVGSLLIKNKRTYVVLEKETGTLFLIDAESKKITNAGIKLSELPHLYPLIKSQSPYLIGFYGNKIFCIKLCTPS